jgi:hypothetical protein
VNHVPDELRGEIVRRLRTLHALKAGALRMFDPMLAAVWSAREDETLAEVSDLLGRMHGAFGGHRAATASHVYRFGAGARLGGRVAAAGGLNFGGAATEAFVFEHVEIAQAHLIEQLATRAQDEQTAGLVREVRADDEEMAATIGRNWTNVLSLSLATRGLPVLRPPEDDA